MAVAWVSALQTDGVIATLTGFGRGYGVDDEKTLNEVALRPYESAIEEAGLWAIEPAVKDAGLLDRVLGQEWGFRGFVMDPATPGDTDEGVRRRLRAMFGAGMFD